MLVDRVAYTLQDALTQTAEWLGVPIAEKKKEPAAEPAADGALLQSISTAPS